MKKRILRQKVSRFLRQKIKDEQQFEQNCSTQSFYDDEEENTNNNIRIRSKEEEEVEENKKRLCF